MSLNSLQRRLPRPIRNAILRRKDEQALARLPKAQCDTSTLARSKPPLGLQPVKTGSMNHKGGAVNPGDQRAIYALAKATGSKRILEVGTHLGGSTVMLARALPDDGHLTTVDVLDVNGPNGAYVRFDAPSPRTLVEQEGLGNKVTFVTRDSIDFLRDCRDQFDFIFLDGLHDADRVYQEIPLSLPRLTSGGLILLHDVYPHMAPLWDDGNIIPGPWLAVQRLRNEGAKLRIEPLGKLPWPTKQGSHVTSLAVLLTE